MSPATEWTEIAQESLLAPSDLDGFELAPQPDYSSPEDVSLPECDDVDQLDERFGRAAATWGIGYRRPATATESEVRLGHTVLVWESENVAERRVVAAIPLVSACRLASITHNFERQATDGSVSLERSELADLDLQPRDGVTTGGYRVRLAASLGGLDFPVYYDFLYAAEGHAITVVDLAALVRPVPEGQRERILDAAVARLRGAQS